jgi:hypothetical protein
MRLPGPIAASVVAWTLGATVSIAVGLLALSLIGVGLTSNSGEHLTQPVDRADNPLGGVVNVTPTVPSPSPTASPTASPPPAAVTGPNRSIETAGGNAVARCEPAGAYLVVWSPSPGFVAGDVNRGPATEARVTFESSTREIKVRVTCIGVTVHSSIEDETNRGSG